MKMTLLVQYPIKLTKCESFILFFFVISKDKYMIETFYKSFEIVITFIIRLLFKIYDDKIL